MSVDYHKEGCEIGNLHPECDHPDCVAGRVWDEMRRAQQEPICRMTAAERAAKAAYETMVSKTVLRWDDMSKIDWAWEKQGPAVRADWIEVITAAVTEERARCLAIIEAMVEQSITGSEDSFHTLEEGWEVDREFSRRVAVALNRERNAAKLPDPDVMIGGEG